MRRRTFLKAAATATLMSASGGARALAASDMNGSVTTFPTGFLWGCSTSAYQIEGAVAEDGRGPSVWDSFSHAYGRIANGDTGDVACDHYRRYPEDIDLMARAGMRAYRFSIAWPRVLPQGMGTVNPKGLDFYDRLTDALLERGIEPWPCLYHWDLPQALQDKGGWLNRDIASWFTDYALAVTARLGDRAKRWVMLNEPSVVAIFGYGTGGHAPGLTGRLNCLTAIHHQNLAQGTALAALRPAAKAKGWQLGTVLSLQPSWPVGGLDSNYPASLMWDALWNRSCLDPLFKGRFPEALEADFTAIAKPGDLKTIQQPIDLLGVNYYSRMHQQVDPQGLFGTGYGSAPEGTRRTAMDWPVEADGLTEILVELQESYGNPPVYVTENGADYVDVVGPSGRVEDDDRIAYLRTHILAARNAINEGCDVRGYMVWTLLDNFEWSEGYRRHFGLVQVDRATMKRTPKASYDWYAKVIRKNGVPSA